jgi:hypothetical protein
MWFQVCYLWREHYKYLVQLIGYCEEGGEQISIYEYMPGGSLQEHLHGELLHCALQKEVISCQPYSREHMSKRLSVYLGMFHVSARVGIYSCLYTPQKATWFLKILFTKAKFEGHKWCKLKF